MNYYLNIYALLYKQEFSLPEIAQALNKNASRIRTVIARMRASDLLCISSFEKVGRVRIVRFKVGNEDAALEGGKHKSQNKPAKKYPAIIAMKSIIDFIDNNIGHSAAEISKHTGIGRHAIYRFIKDATEHGVIHINHWDKSGVNWVPCYSWGIGKSAKKPKPKTKREVNIKYNASSKGKVVRLKTFPQSSIFNLAQLKAA